MSIRILHLSDLHTYDPPHKSLADLWLGARKAVKDLRFDFIVISGDLTRNANASEYGQVADFADDLVSHHLLERECRRVIFVPGNHDVDWTRCRSDQAYEVLAPPYDEWEADRRTLEWAPHDTLFRWSRDEAQGTLRLIRFKKEQYHQRFTTFQAFVDGFYGDHVLEPDRSFAMTGDDAGHWSAHLFPEESVAFYGLSSCSGNDAFWTGAAISEEAVRAASDHALRHAQGLTKIAVWHHGLASGRGSPDHLSMRELGRLWNAGFEIGFHGHTHKEELDDVQKLIGHSFPVIGTGSFGAGPTQRPGGATNQFAIATLGGKRLVVQVFESDGADVSWSARKAEVFDLRPRGVSTADASELTEVDVHSRHFRVNGRSGIADVRVSLENAVLHGTVTLAELCRRTNNLLADARIGPLSPGLPVHTEDEGDKRRYVVTGRGERYAQLAWSYSISNAFSLDIADRERLKAVSLLVPAAHDGIFHTVRFRTNELRLDVEFYDAGSEPVIDGQAVVKVYQPVPGHRESNGSALADEDAWLEDGQRVNAEVTTEGTRISAIIPNPTVGYRYGLVWRLARHGAQYDPNVLELLDELIELCREPRGMFSDISGQLTLELDRAVHAALAVDTGVVPWLGHLWHQQSRALFPCFGYFPNRSWSAVFKYGHGVTGHAHRFSGPTTYSARRARRGDESTIYNAPEEDDLNLALASPHEWILAVPILVRPHGPSVGVVVFADYQMDEWQLSKAGPMIRDLARGSGDMVSARIDGLPHGLSAKFWQVVSRSSYLTDVMRMGAQRILKDFWMRDASAERPKPRRRVRRSTH